MSKIYSVDNGDRGRVTIDGVEVKATHICPEDNWAVVLDIGKTGVPVIERVTGQVTFTPFEPDSIASPTGDSLQ